MKKQIRPLSFLLCSLLMFTTVLAAAQTPGEVIVQTIDRGLQILNDPGLKETDRLKERQERLWELLEPIFNFEEISKRVLGHHWTGLTAQQQQKFSTVFTTLLKDTYLGKSDSYAGERIQYLREIVRGNQSKIQTKFFTTDGKEVSVEFSMNQVNGIWKIYDMTIEGVSMVGNYRTQFNSILTKSSFDELIDTLEKKQKEFAEI